MRAIGVAPLLLGMMALPLAAQLRGAAADSLTRAVQLEQGADWEGAAALYGALLRDRPANVDALMGLERVLPRANRRQDLLAPVARALAADTASVPVLGVAVRVFAGLGMPDSARKYVLRWAKRSPKDESPWREWSDAALVLRDLPQAHAALAFGREALGKPALALEIAQLAQAEADYPAATREWVLAVGASPYFLPGAASLLAGVPPADRSRVRSLLARDSTAVGRRLLGLVVSRWGESAEGLSLLRGAMPRDSSEAVMVLQALLDIFRPRTDRASLVARATTLELLAARQGAMDQGATRLEAARAFAEAGADADARRMLDLVARDSRSSATVQAGVSATRLEVLMAEGKAAEAEQLFRQVGSTLSLDARERSAQRITEAWVRAGDLDRAEALVSGDSSVAGLGLRGRIRLYRGDLAAADSLLKAAGPYDDDQVEALRRVSLLALLQSVEGSALPGLGPAMLKLDQGDSLGAASALEAVAGTIDSSRAAGLRWLAGRIALAKGDSTHALSLFEQADVPGAPGIAAGARLATARMLTARGKKVQAQQLLERLIIEFPESAVVPDARRLRDQLRGALPPGGG